MSNKASRFLTIAFLAILTIPVTAQDGDPVVMTLEECLEYAYKKNEDLSIASLEVDKSRALTGEYLSAGLPQVDVNLAFNKNFIVRKAFIPANIFNPSAPEGEVLELPFGTPYDGDIGLNVSQMVFNGSYFVGLRASKILQELSEKEVQRSKIDITEAVTKAYYTVLVTKESNELVQANFDRLDTLLRETTIMYENGFAEKIDVNRTKVEFNNTKTQLDNSKRSLLISKQLLKFQMGMPVDTPLQIAEAFEDLSFNIDELLQLEADHQRRIEYSIINTQQSLTEMDMKNNKVQYLPKIDLFFAWGMNAGLQEANNLLKWGDRQIWPDYQLAGITMNIPIFDGLYKAKRIQQNRIELMQIAHQRDQLRNSIRREVNEKRNNLLNSMEQLRNQEENMGLAEEVYAHAKIKYQEGVGSNLEVIEADNAFKTAQTNYYSALYEALLSEVEYEKALGILLQ